MADRHGSRASIVSKADIIEFDAIGDESWRLLTLLPELATKIQTLEWLARRSLIKNEVLCTTCQQPARLTVFARGIDGYHWKCYCHNFTQSVRHGSFFTRSHLDLEQLVQLLYMWAMDFQQDQIMVELGIQENSRHTVIDWCNSIHEVSEEHLKRNLQTLGRTPKKKLRRQHGNRVRNNRFGGIIAAIIQIYPLN